MEDSKKNLAFMAYRYRHSSRVQTPNAMKPIPLDTERETPTSARAMVVGEQATLQGAALPVMKRCSGGASYTRKTVSHLLVPVKRPACGGLEKDGGVLCCVCDLGWLVCELMVLSDADTTPNDQVRSEICG